MEMNLNIVHDFWVLLTDVAEWLGFDDFGQYADSLEVRGSDIMKRATP